MTDKEIIQELLRVQGEQHVKIENIAETCKEIRDSVVGNGNPGLRTKVALLEHKEKSRTKFMWILIVAIVTLLTETAMSFIQ